MLTCRDLLQLDSFRGVKLVAGGDGLDNAISWPYPKHTKSISPWVKNGEFLMVSGFEIGVNDAELISLIAEAASNCLSGILVEGGMNFSEISEPVREAADQAKIPLFFTPSVVSFLDLSREISGMILEQEFIQKFSTSLLDKLLQPGALTEQELAHLLRELNIPDGSLFSLARFSIAPKNAQSRLPGHPQSSREKNLIANLSKLCAAALNRLTGQIHEQKGLDALTFLLYGSDADALQQQEDALTQVRAQVESLHGDFSLHLSFSGRVQDPLALEAAVLQTLYTDTLMNNQLIPSPVQSFDNTGSYQLLFHIADKDALLNFRDAYLRELFVLDQVNSSELLKTLQVFLQNCGNMMRTAEQLYTHRNTLQYRIDRIKTITGKNLNDATVRRDFLNALMVLDLYPFSSLDRDP